MENTPFGLTSRQRDVMDLVYLGCSDRVIAEDLGISYGTVRGHFAECMRKIGATNRVQAAVAYALQLADVIG